MGSRAIAAAAAPGMTASSPRTPRHHMRIAPTPPTPRHHLRIAPSPRTPPHGKGPGPRSQRAFTLVEILVVVALVGLVVALAAVNLMPGDREVARREAARLALAIENARDSAWFGGRPVALQFAEGRLRRLARDGHAWRADAGRDTALGEGVRVASVSVNGRPLEAGDGLVFMPDGLDEPFRVALEVRGLAWAIDGDAAGSIRVVER